MTTTQAGAARPIGPYERRTAVVHAWDPRALVVAERVRDLVAARRPDLVVEHIGSTAVPGLPGKGIVDLSVEAHPDEIPAIVRMLYELGFQPQPGPDPWPPTRPMPVGSMEVEGETFRIHFHVQPIGGTMPRDIAFRDALRADPELVRQYADLKWSITAGGEIEGLRYTHSKTAWIAGVYRRLGFAFGFPPVLPPATIGILGGGQLGRMLGLAARELGYRVAVLDPDPACPASAVADRVEVAGYDDVDAAKRLAEGCGVVTYELEHVAEAVVAALDDGSRPVRPGLHPLRVTQDRLAERRFLEANDAPVAPWREVASGSDLDAAITELGFPLRLKVAIGGYDGRNQMRLAGPGDLAAARAMLDSAAGSMLLERELAFASELSVIVARSFDGAIAPFPPAANVHDAGILVESAAPASVAPAVSAAATELATRLATAMGLIGLLTVEMFRMPDDSVVVNELAPRVHNSGHWTIEAAVTSQFEQQVRAICGLPLGSPGLRSGAAATVNVLGTGASRVARLEGVPEALGEPDVHLHLYDKREVFERRKMGHVTALADDVETALARARAARARLRWLE